MKISWTVMSTVMFCMMVAVAHATPRTFNNPKTHATSEFSLSDREIEERLTNIQLPFTVRSSAQARSMVRAYVVDGYRDSEYILGRAEMYMPVFEHYLKLYGLPISLKYLPVVESALKSNVESPMGAAGLWQFVPATARLYNLTVGTQIDERLDPNRATEAAVRMLAALHEQFGDWGLVLAAYNCGPGRVRSAMRQAGARNFWAIKEYLPQETQKYIPRFMAAAYLMNYYQLHSIVPNKLSSDLADTRTFRIYKPLALGTLAKNIGVPYSTLKSLNPGFISGYIPANDKGYLIIIPTRAAAAFANAYTNAGSVETPRGYRKNFYTTVAGDNLQTLAQLFRCSKEDIMRWNGLQSEHLAVHQTLTVFLPSAVAKP